MAFQDELVKFRESLLNAALGILQTETLNVHNIKTASTLLGLELAAEIKQMMDQFKAAAMDENGEHVNYNALAESAAYMEYHNQFSPRLQHFDPTTLGTRENKLAFWINLYNALIMEAVIRFKVKDSVAKGLDILRFFRRAAYNVGGHRMTAEYIEHGILRANRGNPYLPGPQFGPNDPRLNWTLDIVDPRIHFALNCASKSCPPVGVYTPEKIDEQLDRAAQNFIMHEVKVDYEKGVIYLSQIFNWYKTDFGGTSGVLDFISHFPLQRQQPELRFKVRYKPYDWGLNV